MTYRACIRSRHLPDDEPVRLISPALDAGDAPMVAGLLATAAGEQTSAHDLSERQYDLLLVHRSLSLLPPSWRLPPTRNLAVDRAQALALQMKLLAGAASAASHLDEAGIDNRMLKGVASCELDYPEASMRTFGDIDMLVRPDDFVRAVDAFETIGCTRLLPGASGDRYRAAAALASPDGFEIDLHYRLLRLVQTTPALVDELFDRPVALAAGHAMSVEGRLVHAASHLMFAPPGMRRLSGLADISAIRSTHAIDLGHVRKLAALMDAEAIVAAALALERTLRGLPVDTNEWREPTRLEWGSYLRADRQLAVEHLLALSRLDGVSERARYVRHRLGPSSEAAAMRGGYLSYFKRALPKRLGGQYSRNPR